MEGYSRLKIKMRIYGRGCREFEGEIVGRLEGEERLLVDEGSYGGIGKFCVFVYIFRE